jgi:uncharacterized membrane protein YoaT (DUF817 family)
MSLFTILYVMLLVMYAFFTFFIVFHISRYSINRPLAPIVIAFFLIGTAILVAANVALFFSIPFDYFDLPDFSLSPKPSF